MNMDYQPRNVAVVACYIASILPKQQTNFKEEIMEYVLKDLAYKSPELLRDPLTWSIFETIMHRYIQEPDEDWKKQIIDVYLGKTEIPTNVS